MLTYHVARDELGNIRYCDAANSQFAVVLLKPGPQHNGLWYGDGLAGGCPHL